MSNEGKSQHEENTEEQHHERRKLRSALTTRPHHVFPGKYVVSEFKESREGSFFKSS